MKIKKICIIGYGLHVEKTIIPSLALNKKNIKIITKKKIIDKFETYPDLKTGLKMITKDYVVFNSTPPREHYLTSKLILSSGFNLIVEKPICLKVEQLNKLRKLAKHKKLFMFENMMYFYTKQFSTFKKIINGKKAIDSINLNFSIPNFNKNSFRSNENINSSLLYDVGCYPISLISYFNFKIKKFKIFYEFKKGLLNKLDIRFKSNKINFFITINFFKKYQNFVKINFDNKSSIQLNYFFYGKKVKKNNSFILCNKKIKNEIIFEGNIFKKIFNFDSKKFFKLSNQNYIVIKNYLRILDRIKKKLYNSSDQF